MVQESEIVQIDPPIGLGPFFDGKPPKLWCSGEQRILSGNFLGIISSREADADLVARSAKLLQQLTSLKEINFIGGWHSPLEKEALRILLVGSAQFVICVAKSLNRFAPPAMIENQLRQRQALLLTHCSPRARRISREASLRCNQLVVALANSVLVLSAPEASSSLQLARSALKCQKPVLAIEHPLNTPLLESGALLASVENVQNAFADAGL